MPQNQWGAEVENAELAEVVEPSAPGTASGPVGPTLGYATPSRWGDIARRGKLLITPRTVTLPELCIKTGQNADEAAAAGHPLVRIDKTMTWYPVLILATLLLPGGILVLLVLYIVLRKTAGVGFSVRRDFLRRRRRVVALASLGALLGIGAFIASFIVAEETQNDTLGIGVGIGGLVLLIASTVYGTMAGRLLWPRRINKVEAQLQGAGPGFLDQIADVRPI